MNKLTPTDVEIKEAYALVNKFKRYYQFNEDDVQTVITKFFESFNTNKNEVKPFLMMLCKQHNVNKWYRQGQKRASAGISSIDANESLDWQRYLSTSDKNHLEDEEELQSNLQLIQNSLNLLNKPQRYAVEEYYLKERSCIDIATELGITKQAVFQRIKTGLNKIRKHNNINV